MTTPEERILQLLKFLYGEETGIRTWHELRNRLEEFRRRNPHLRDQVPPPEERLTARDAILITYPDQIREPQRPPLSSLEGFLRRYLQDRFNGVHILPFFPYSSDDGFSVIDYKQVHPEFGTWEDVERIARRFRLMVDAVINHISRESPWFQAFLRGEEPYKDYFIVVDPSVDLSMVVRPRATPLLTPVETVEGIKYVWTTFSADQIDLNYHNPRVLLDIIDVLLFYVEKGAEIIRLDAIAYVWKEIGTPCIHLPQTHALVKLFRAVFDAVAPGVLIITETNVPHRENVSYFGNGYDEAQLVYNFALPPLVLHTFHTGNAQKLSEWAATLETPSDATTFFNFIASHDGIGVLPAKGILTDAEIQALVERTFAHGGLVSYRALPDGGKSVYELNITLYDALNDPAHPNMEKDVRRFLASQVIMLALAGIPGIYVHSLFGSRNCHRCVRERGYPRAINREKFTREAAERMIHDATLHSYHVFHGYMNLLKVRRGEPAFHPNATQQVLRVDDRVFVVIRRPAQGRPVITLVNVTDNHVSLRLSKGQWGDESIARWKDLLRGRTFNTVDSTLTVSLEPYEFLWLVPHGPLSSESVTVRGTTSSQRAEQPLSHVAIQDLYSDHLAHCYGCGRLNEYGYHLKTYWLNEKETVAHFTPRPYHIAIPGYVYGGLIASLIDCHGTGTAAAFAARARGQEKEPPRFLTASLHVDYLKPTPLGPELELRGRAREIKGRKVVVEVDLYAAGVLRAKGEVVCVEVPDQYLQDLLNRSREPRE